MMLRASVEETGRRVDLRAITDRAVEPLLEGGRALLDLVDATLSGDDAGRAAAAAAVGELGDGALVDAAGVIGTFSMMNRIADATGMPVGRGALQRTAEVRSRTGIDRFRRE